MLTNAFRRSLKSLFAPSRPRRNRRRAAARSVCVRGAIERLEDRTMLSADPRWAFSLGTAAGSDSAHRVEVAPDGDVVMVGTFQGTVDFDLDPDNGAGELTSVEGGAFIARYTTDTQQQPKLEWATAFGADSVNQVEFDMAGNIYIVGSFSGSAQFGLETLTSSGQQDVYAAKLNSSGVFQWAESVGGAGQERVAALAVGSDGTIHVGGGMRETVDFDPGVSHTGDTDILTSAGGEDAFLWQLDTNGGFVNAVLFGGSGNDLLQRLAVDNSDGSIAVVGAFNDSVDFGIKTLTSNGTPGGTFVGDTFVAKLNSDGSAVWVEQIGGTGHVAHARMDMDAAGNIYVAGHFNADVNFPGQPQFVSAGGHETYVSKWDADGNVLWVKYQSGGNAARPAVLQVDATGNVYFVSDFTGTIDFSLDNPGANTLTRISESAGSDGFLLRLDADSGAFHSVYHLQADSQGTLQPWGLAVDASGILYVSGEFTGVATFPMGEVLTASGEGPLDLFLLKLNPELGAIHGQVFNDLNNDGAGVGNVTVSLLDAAGAPLSSTTTDNLGRYAFFKLDLGVTGAATFVVSHDSTSQAVPLVEGEIRTGIDFGEFIPNATTTYSNNSRQKIKDLTTITSTIEVSDSFNIFDVDVQLDITHKQLSDLDIFLIAPDGTRVELTMTYPRLLYHPQ